MQLNTTGALATALISAVIGFGLAFYIERKLSSRMQKKSQKISTSIAMISFGYGLMATLNEVVGFPLQGLHIRYDKLVGLVLVNIIFLPIIFIGIAKFIGLKNKAANININKPLNQNLSDVRVMEGSGKNSVAQSKVGLSEVNLSEQEKNALYACAFDEVERGDLDKGLWAKCFAASNGNDSQAKAKYIELRFAELNASAIENKMANEIVQNFDSLIRRADNNEVAALVELGSIWYQGLHNQQKRFVAAFDCFRKASYLGNAKAQYMLSTMFWKGEGTDRNKIYAHAWAVIASSEMLDAKNNVGIFQREMTTDEIYKSDDLVKSLIGKITKSVVEDNSSTNDVSNKGQDRRWFLGLGLLVVAFVAYSLYGNYAPQLSSLLPFNTKKTYAFYAHKIWENCNSPYEDKPIMTMEFMFNTQSKEIIAKIDYEDKGVKKQDFTKLEPCFVHDEKNWRCGGNLLPNGKDFSAQYEMADGKFIYSESTYAKCAAKIIER